MRRIFKVILAGIILPGIMGCGQQANNHESVEAESTVPFAYLQGEWQMADSGRVISEVWTMLNDSLYEANTAIISGDSITPVEKIRLHYPDTAFVYEVELAGSVNGAKIPFVITRHDNNGFTAENPDNAFPKRITYKLINPDSLQATIDDGDAGQRMDFYYSRKK